LLFIIEVVNLILNGLECLEAILELVIHFGNVFRDFVVNFSLFLLVHLADAALTSGHEEWYLRFVHYNVVF
jgi:hypothetical protein